MSEVLAETLTELDKIDAALAALRPKYPDGNLDYAFINALDKIEVQARSLRELVIARQREA